MEAETWKQFGAAVSALVRISRSYEPLGLRVEKSISFLYTLHLPCTVLAFLNTLHLIAHNIPTFTTQFLNILYPIAPNIPTFTTKKEESYLSAILVLNHLFFLYFDLITSSPAT